MPVDPSHPAAAHITAHTTLVPAINAWEYYLDDQGRSPHTIKAFINDVRMLASYLPPDRSIGAVTTQDLNHFLQWLQSERGVPCSPKSLARRITSLKSYFRWLHQAGVVLVDPAEKVLQQSVISPLPEVLTPEEIESVTEAAQKHRIAARPDARYSTLFLLLVSTGIKKGECMALSPNHLDLEAPGGPILFVRYASPSNRYKERKIGLTPEWVDSYGEYAAQFSLTDRLFPWSQRRLEYLLEDLGKEACLSKHLSFDMCRWTCALTDWTHDMESEKIRQKMGVSKIQWREINMKLRSLAGVEAKSA
jgi:site-specific recombinase XerD